jgi:hypothetical protein
MAGPIAAAPREGENDAWLKHVRSEFAHIVTGPMLSNRECSATQAAIAHMQGFINCAFVDALERGDGARQIMPDVLAIIEPWLNGLKNGSAVAVVKDKFQPRLTLLPGGKPEYAA